MKLKVQAPLDADFAPMELLFRAYVRDVEKCGKKVPIAVNVERNQGYCDYIAMDVFPEDEEPERTKEIVERSVKTLLWCRGG